VGIATRRSKRVVSKRTPVFRNKPFTAKASGMAGELRLMEEFPSLAVASNQTIRSIVQGSVAA
jgi:hypothetical protein